MRNRFVADDYTDQRVAGASPAGPTTFDRFSDPAWEYLQFALVTRGDMFFQS